VSTALRQRVRPAPDQIDRLNANELRAALGHCTIGREIIVLEETTSTNDSILQRVAPPTREGLIIFAERQTAGRGQRHNRWESTAHKGLWFSILLRPQIPVAQSARLTAWAAQTVAQTIVAEFALPVMIKSPNDVYVNGKKIAGVLVEMRAQENASHFVILGIGINVHHRAEDFSKDLRERAVSLAMVLNRHIDRSRLAIALLRNLDRSYNQLCGL
jgi:BirA family biotin operon repressor/biotin-[acetyl-CoA-carboxylase] ligase